MDGKRSAPERLCNNRRLVVTAVVALLSAHSSLLAYSATRHSPTMLEPALLASGISHWHFGRFELYRVNPPLVRMIAALPVMAAGCESDWSRFYDAPGARSEFAVGEDFIKANGRRSIPLFFYARWACIPFSLIGACFAFRWANELYGAGAGLLTLALWCFEPNLLAHAELITPDSACTSFGVAAAYFFWKWLKSPRWFGAVLAGLFLGLAELSKMSWLMLFGLWPALWIAWRWLRRKSDRGGAIGATRVEGIQSADGIDSQSRGLNVRPAQTTNGGNSSLSPATSLRRQSLQLATILLIALYLLNLGYAFDESFTKLEDFNFVSRLMTGLETAGSPGNRFVGAWVGEIPLPLPKQYVLGFDAQKKDFEQCEQPSYLCGEWKQGGWWYYYLYGLLVKVPSGTLLLFIAVILRRLTAKIRFVAIRDEMLVLVPALALLWLVSSQTAFNHHLRYVFPSLGLGLVFCGQGIHFFTSTNRHRGMAVLVLVGYSAISALSCYPHHLAYFNDFVGGPRNGQKHLLHSSLDWGQDLLIAADWIRSRQLADRRICADVISSYQPRALDPVWSKEPCSSAAVTAVLNGTDPDPQASLIISRVRLAERSANELVNIAPVRNGAPRISGTHRGLKKMPCWTLQYLAM